MKNWDPLVLGPAFAMDKMPKKKKKLCLRPYFERFGEEDTMELSEIDLNATSLTRSSMLQLEVLVGELVAVDTLSAGSVVVGEVSSLAHEVGDDPVEGGALVAEALLVGAERAEVLGSAGNNVNTQLKMQNNKSHPRAKANKSLKQASKYR